ncbi:hypothetical protein [Derxia gummosa]|uniref:Uncharacterized protein n=1 Tax=Derxia gummosa DSM 723 TaxID=1121388 RepID=A0A8B6XCC2_9BURK|nr:hypothetical protein [Derxia gummosa]
MSRQRNTINRTVRVEDVELHVAATEHGKGHWDAVARFDLNGQLCRAQLGEPAPNSDCAIEEVARIAIRSIRNG